MSDATTVKVICDTPDLLGLHLTNISDSTGESAVVKADKSAYTARDGAEPASLDILTVRWNIQGFTSVRLLWDHTTDDVAMALSGSGFDDFSRVGPSNLSYDGSRNDPRSAGDTGDLLLTTAGAISGATYDITIWLKKSSD